MVEGKKQRFSRPKDKAGAKTKATPPPEPPESESTTTPADGPEGTKRRTGRKDIALDNVFFLPSGAIESFAKWRRVGEPDEVYKTEAIDVIVEQYLDGMVAKLVELGFETMLPRDERKSIRLSLSSTANAALDHAAERTGLDKLHILTAAIRVAAEVRGVRANKP